MENKSKIQNTALFGIIFDVSKLTTILPPLVWLFIFFKIRQQTVGLTEKFRTHTTLKVGFKKFSIVVKEKAT